MSNIFIPETVDIPFDSLTNEQRDAIVLIMTEKGFQNPLTDIIDKSLNLCDIEIQNLIGLFPLPFVDDPWPGLNALTINGFYPLYATPEEAIEKSPLPNYSRPGETTEGYHTHNLNGNYYYMPNGLGGPDNIMGTQFHGTHGTTGYGATGEETTTYYYDESGATIPYALPDNVVLEESGNNAYDPLSILNQMGEGGWTIGIPPVADEVSGNSYGACIVNGVCEINTIPGCNNIGGVFMGENTVCAGDYLTGHTGSCCLDVYGDCVSLNQLDCQVAGGVYGGSGSTCGAMGSTIGANGEVIYLLCSNETNLSNLTRFDIFLSDYTGAFATNEQVYSDGGFSAIVDSWYPQSDITATLRVYDILGTLSSGVSGGPPPDIVKGANSGATGYFSHIAESPTGDTGGEEEGDGGGTYSSPQGSPGGTSDWIYDEYGVTIGGGVYYPPSGGGDSGIVYGDAPVYVPVGPQEIEYNLFSGPIPGTPFDVDSVPPPVEVLPLTRGQADVIINALEKIKLNLYIFKHHTNTISGVDGESMESFFHRLSTAGAYTNLMKTIAGRGEHSYSFVFGTIMGLGEIMLDKILKGTECAPCLNCKESATVTSGSGIGGIAQEVWLNPSAYNSAIERLEEIALSILALIDEEEEKYCKAQKVVHNYTTGQQLLNQTKNDPIFEALVDRVFSTPQFKDKIKEVKSDSTTDKFFPSFKLLEQKTSVTLAELAVAPYPDLGSPCVCIDCEDDDIKLQRYLIKIFSSLGKGTEDGVSCKAGVLSSTEFLEGPVGYPGLEGLLGNLGIPGAPGICDYGPCEQEPAHYGACCLTTSTCGNCLQTNLEQCNFYGGDYHGDDTHCTFEECGKCFSNAECVVRGEVCCDGYCHTPPCPVCEIDDDCLGPDSCCFSGQCAYCPPPTCVPPCGTGLQCCPDFTCCPTCCGGNCCEANEICCGGACCAAGSTCCGDTCCGSGVECCGDSCGCGYVGEYCCGDTCCDAPLLECRVDSDCPDCFGCSEYDRCVPSEGCQNLPDCPPGSYAVCENCHCSSCHCYTPPIPPEGGDECCKPEASCPPGFSCVTNSEWNGGECSCVFNACLEEWCDGQEGYGTIHNCPEHGIDCNDTCCCEIEGICCHYSGTGINVFGEHAGVCEGLQYCLMDCADNDDGCCCNGYSEGGMPDNCANVWQRNFNGLGCNASCADWMNWWQANGGPVIGGGVGYDGNGSGNSGQCCGDGCGCDYPEICCDGVCCIGQTCCGGDCCNGDCCSGDCCPDPIGANICCGGCCNGNSNYCCNDTCCPNDEECCSDGCCEGPLNSCCIGDFGAVGECCPDQGQCCGTDCCSEEQFCHGTGLDKQCCPLNSDGTEPVGNVCNPGDCPCPDLVWACDGSYHASQCCGLADGHSQCSLFCCGNSVNPVPSDIGCCSHSADWTCDPATGNAYEFNEAISACGGFPFNGNVGGGYSNGPGCPCDCLSGSIFIDNGDCDGYNYGNHTVYYTGNMGVNGVADCDGRWYDACNNKWKDMNNTSCSFPCQRDAPMLDGCYCGTAGWCGISDGDGTGYCDCVGDPCLEIECHDPPSGQERCILPCEDCDADNYCDICIGFQDKCTWEGCGPMIGGGGACAQQCGSITGYHPDCENAITGKCPCDEPLCSGGTPFAPPSDPGGCISCDPDNGIYACEGRFNCCLFEEVYCCVEGACQASATTGLNNELSINNTEVNVEVTFQIVDFVADDKIKTPAITLQGTPGGGSLSHPSSAEIRGDDALGKENFEDQNAKTSVVKGSLTATITDNDIIGESQLISFVSGSNIKLSSNEYKNIIKISADDMTLTENIVDVEDRRLATTRKYWLIRGTSDEGAMPVGGTIDMWNIESIDGPSGDIGFDGYTGPTGGIYDNSYDENDAEIRGILTRVTDDSSFEEQVDGITFDSNALNIVVATPGGPGHFLSIGTGGSGSWGASSDITVNITNGFTSGGTIDFNESVVDSANFKDVSEHLSVAAEAPQVILRHSEGNVKYVTGTAGQGTTANCNIILYDAPEANQTGTMTLYIENGGLFLNYYGCFCDGATLDPDTSILWAGGVEPTLSTAGVDVVSFLTIDGGTSYYGIANGINFNS